MTLLITEQDVLNTRAHIINERNYWQAVVLSLESFQDPIAIKCDSESLLHTAENGYFCSDNTCHCGGGAEKRRQEALEEIRQEQPGSFASAAQEIAEIQRKRKEAGEFERWSYSDYPPVECPWTEREGWGR